MADATLAIEAFGDPFCPWDFSAEPARARLRWRYGDGIDLTHRMIVLSERPEDYDDKGISAEDIGQGRAMLAKRFGMPIVPEAFPRQIATMPACRAVVGVRTHGSPEGTAAFLRRLRVLIMSELMLADEPNTIDRAAREAGLDPTEVAAWARSSETAAGLADDMRVARSPDPVALAMPERLAGIPDGGMRFTCPSYVLRAGDRTLQAPGFQPARVYEVLVANIAPDLAPRPNPGDVGNVIDWAPYPLATAEVAAILESSIADVGEALEASSAVRTETRGGPYWSRG